MVLSIGSQSQGLSNLGIGNDQVSSGPKIPSRWGRLCSFDEGEDDILGNRLILIAPNRPSPKKGIH